MAVKATNPQQIVRKDGSNCFVEVVSSSFPIGRVLFRFINYNKQAAQGSRYVDNVEIYLTIPAFLRIAYDFESGRLDAVLNKNKQDAINQGYKYAFPLVLDLGGKSAKKLAAAGKARPDNMSLSRQLKIASGDKRPYLLIAESGPGEEDEKGLIVPKYKTPEHKVTIPLSVEDMIEILEATKMHIQAYLASDYVATPVESRMPTIGQQGPSEVSNAPANQGYSNTYNNNGNSNYQNANSNYNRNNNSAPNSVPYGNTNTNNNRYNNYQNQNTNNYNRQYSSQPMNNIPTPSVVPNANSNVGENPMMGMNVDYNQSLPQAGYNNSPMPVQNSQPTMNDNNMNNQVPGNLSSSDESFFNSMAEDNFF